MLPSVAGVCNSAHTQTVSPGFRITATPSVANPVALEAESEYV